MAHNDKSLSLATRKSLKEHEGNINGALANIQKATGVTFTFETDYAKIAPAIEADRREVGHATKSFLEGLSESITKMCKDDMVKEALVDAATAKKIVYDPTPTGKTSRASTIKDGVIVVNCDVQYFHGSSVNGDLPGHDLEKAL